MTDRETSALASPPTASEPADPWDRWIDRFFAPFGGGGGFGPSTAVGGISAAGRARTDVSETPKAYQIVVDLPGVAKDGVQVKITGTTVEIEGKTGSEGPGTAAGYLHRERRSGAYYRALELPEPVVGRQASAKLVDGVLTLEVPKLHPAEEVAEVQVPVA